MNQRALFKKAEGELDFQVIPGCMFPSCGEKRENKQDVHIIAVKSWAS